MRKRVKSGDEVPFPKSYLPPHMKALDFEHLLGLKKDKDLNDSLLPKRSTLWKLRAKQQDQVHERESTFYLSPYEFEHKILETMNATRGLNPRARVQRRGLPNKGDSLIRVV